MFCGGAGFSNPWLSISEETGDDAGKNPAWQFVHEEDLINVMVLLLEKRIVGAF
ncbi:MAG: hypothetical protein R2875_08170 [Desulfobacterales bacterium]